MNPFGIVSAAMSALTVGYRGKEIGLLPPSRNTHDGIPAFPGRRSYRATKRDARHRRNVNRSRR